VTKFLSSDDINPELTLEQDIPLEELSKHGLMVAPISTRNREFL
jgi:hypothetical protein